MAGPHYGPADDSKKPAKPDGLAGYSNLRDQGYLSEEFGQRM
jgi:hypothetical protein